MMHILTIAGSDGSGGAGIQGDLKTIASHNAHGLSVITAITMQNTTEIASISPLSDIKMQLDILSKDIPIHGIKIGMLYTKNNVHDVINFLKSYALLKKIPVVIDPLMFASTGKLLVQSEALDCILHELLPLATLITPNTYEARYMAKIFDTTIEDTNDTDLISIGNAIVKAIGVPVLLKGGHSHAQSESDDLLFNIGTLETFSSPRLKAPHNHGTGCCLSSAITCNLAKGLSLKDSIQLGKLFVTSAIKHGYSIGKGVGPVDPLIHFITNTVTMNNVANTCLATGSRPIMAEAMDEMSELIPANNGLVLNLGTLNDTRLATMQAALNYIDKSTQPVLLDPVGCGSSTYRLRAAKNLLLSGKIQILKLNTREAIALLDDACISRYGVDSHDIPRDKKIEFANQLVQKFSPNNPEIIVIITGEIDVVANAIKSSSISGGTRKQKSITGTGCMLNAVIMSQLAKSNSPYDATVKAIKTMNKASERATRKLTNKAYHMNYQNLLINELGASASNLYLITDESLDFETSLVPKTIQALEHGVGWLQYRCKHKPREVRFREAKVLRELTLTYGVNFIINDDVFLAKSVNADGLHLGADDLTISEARKLLGNTAIIGATAKTLDQAFSAQSKGADYLGVGALNPSPTKPEAIPVDLETLKLIGHHMTIPIFGIGGIRYHNLSNEVLECLDGIAIVSAYYQGGLDELDKLKQLL